MPHLQLASPPTTTSKLLFFMRVLPQTMVHADHKAKLSTAVRAPRSRTTCACGEGRSLNACALCLRVSRYPMHHFNNDSLARYLTQRTREPTHATHSPIADRADSLAHPLTHPLVTLTVPLSQATSASCLTLLPTFLNPDTRTEASTSHKTR